MKLLRVISVAAFASLTGASAGLAADLYSPSYTPDIAFVPNRVAYDWSGFYIGGSVGYSWAAGNSEFAGPAVPPIIAAVPIDINPQGAAGMLHAGVNQQFDSIVVGVEGTVGYGNVTATEPDPLIGLVAPPGSTVTTTTDYTWALMARAGLALDNFMPYVTAGYVGAHVSTTATAGGADDQALAHGWGVGAGLEVALDDNWSVRGQYLYSQLYGPRFNEGLAYETHSNPTSSTVTAGVNYRF